MKFAIDIATGRASSLRADAEGRIYVSSDPEATELPAEGSVPAGALYTNPAGALLVTDGATGGSAGIAAGQSYRYWGLVLIGSSGSTYTGPGWIFLPAVAGSNDRSAHSDNSKVRWASAGLFGNDAAQSWTASGGLSYLMNNSDALTNDEGNVHAVPSPALTVYDFTTPYLPAELRLNAPAGREAWMPQKVRLVAGDGLGNLKLSPLIVLGTFTSGQTKVYPLADILAGDFE